MSPAAAPGVPVHALAEWHALSAALDNATTPIPCQGTRSEDWQATKGDQAEFALRACLDCPVMVACGRYAVTAEEPCGIWGGLTPKDRAVRKGATR